MSMSSWKEIAKARKQKQEDSIPKEWRITLPPPDRTNVLHVPEECGLLSARELEITNQDDVLVTLDKLARGEWSSVQVTTAYSKRAIIAHQLTNCLTEIFIERALVRAAEVDAYLKRTGKVMGPLHGLPVSLKDQVRIKGLETIMGYVSWVGKVDNYDAVLTQILYDAGAVPYVRTNVPQTLWWGETYNEVFGRTSNPHNLTLTPGGSSGGEGALIAMKGSPLGVGTDIGGSVRIPSAFCGIYSLRPSSHRLPYRGLANSSEGQEAVHSVIGPMTPTVSGLKVFTQAVLASEPWLRDPLVLRKPWSEEEYKLNHHGGGVGMCFAIMQGTDIVEPTPPVLRALKDTKAALEAAGHTVIDWVNLKHEEIHYNVHAIYEADGGKDAQLATLPTGEPLLTSIMPEDSPHVPIDIPMEKWVLLQPPPNQRPASDKTGETKTTYPPSRSAWDLWQLHTERRDLRGAYLDHWQATKERTGTGRAVDAVICPAAAYAAPPHGLNSDSFYTSLWNALDYTASVFPVTVVDPKLDVKIERTEFKSHEDEYVHQWYDPELFKDAPVGLQLVGRTQEEEGVIAMTEIVDRALKDYRKGGEDKEETRS